MTTETRNVWASLLEDASQREIRQMAEYAIDHLENTEVAKQLAQYINGHVWNLTVQPGDNTPCPPDDNNPE